MTMSPLAFSQSLRIGTIDFVSPDEVKVLLDIEAPDAVALNTGSPRAFPRINSYLLLPGEIGHVVAQVQWITIERSQYPKRKGMQDFGLIDLPYPLRRLSVAPLGMLSQDSAGKFRFTRGVDFYPTVGEPAFLPTESQLRSIVESGAARRIRIGISPLAASAVVSVDPDRLFGRHLAVLGNTGSGKSRSVAGLIRWSLEAARSAANGADPNARFVVLDPNGEYANTFRDLSKVRVFGVEPSNELMKQLQVPLWFWNTSEWAAFTQASGKVQRPVLVQALRSVRDGNLESAASPSHDMRRFIRTLVSATQLERNAGNPWKGFGQMKGFLEKIRKWRGALDAHDLYTQEESASLSVVREYIDQLVDARTPTQSNKWPTLDFGKEEVDELLDHLREAHGVFGGLEKDVLPIDADIPRPFTGDQLLRSVEANAELLNVSDYVETMLIRIRTILSDTRMKTVTASPDGLTLESWLTDYIGGDGAANGSVTVIDLSLVPSEVIHIVAAVIARMTHEALQRYRRLNDGKTLPTVLVMEEAHTFVKRYKEDAENENAAAICAQVFEKIAREGRKFGLGLVLSSQRPSELSPTVLSQCNSYLLHRISNDRDQELVQRLVPDNLRGLLRDLPSLPSRHAILLGWASELPVLVQMDHLTAEHRPRSDDPDFWAVWTGRDPSDSGEESNVQRPIDWKQVADDWQQTKL
jgi:uncharacterized protein